MTLNPQRTVDELKELRALTGDEDGAQRVAWTETWARARAWLRRKLDVLPVEPVPAGSRLATHPRVILTPHSAFYSVESERELRRKAAQNLVTWLATGRPDYVVTKGTRKP